MNSTTKTISLVFIGLLCFGLFQWYSKYAIESCVDVVESLALDYQQCFSGDFNGIVGINLKVNPIAYKIAMKKKRLAAYIKAWQSAKFVYEVLGSTYQKELHERIADPYLASIAKEIFQHRKKAEKQAGKLPEYMISGAKSGDKPPPALQDYSGN